MANTAESAQSAAESANQSAKDVARSKPVEIGARVGLFSYGITHLLIAWLAIQVAFGDSGEKANQTGAFQELAQNAAGRVLLWVLVVGFVATALWRLTQAIWGFGYETDRKKAIQKRVTSGVKVVIFAGLAVLAAKTAVGSGGGGGQQKATAGVLGLPGGQFLVGIAGVVVIVVGGVKVYEGWKKEFLSEMSLPSDRRAKQVAVRTGQVGFFAKGASIVLIGVLVVVAAVQFRPEESSGLDAALKSLAGQPFGPYLLVLVALGLAAYGIFCFFDARYHRV